MNVFRYAVNMDKLTFQTPVAVWTSRWFKLQSSLENLWESNSKTLSQAQASDGTLPF